MKRVLVTWGSERGGTAGIGRTIASVLRDHGFEVVTTPAGELRGVTGYDAAVIGGALYANRWHRDAARFVRRNLASLRRIPVWFFSSGPLDDSAKEDLPPASQVSVLMELVGAHGHATFGGRLEADARGFPASAMAREHAGDWRDPERIRAWATEVAKDLPDAKPGEPVEPPGRAPWRISAYGVILWALLAGVLAGGEALASTDTAVIAHAIAAPLLAILVSIGYFRLRGARGPLPVALAFTFIVGALDAFLIAGLSSFTTTLVAGLLGYGIPVVAIFLGTWITGVVMEMKPLPKPAERDQGTGTRAPAGRPSSPVRA